MPEETAIQAKGVSKDFVLPHEKVTSIKGAFTSFYKKKQKSNEIQHALQGIEFEVKKGEFFGIVGRNGSGKSTLLKILAGIYQPTHGRVHTAGKLVPFIELGVGFNPELTGRENVYLNGAMLGFSEKEVDAMYQEIVDFAELERFMDQKLKNYSSGMQVRLAFSMATRSEADILLVDEVLAVGDADFQRKCFQYFKELKLKQKTVVFVTHDMSAVREYCDRAMMIERSKVVHIGSPDEIATEYVKLFNNPQPAQKSDKESKGRWGDGKMKIDSVDVVADEASFQIHLQATAKEDAKEPIFGYLIKDATGNELIGSNTKIQKLETGHISKGQHISIKWKMPNVFNDGTFTITVAISHDDGVTQYDWWENAETFTVYREDKTPYALNPTATVKLEKS